MVQGLSGDTANLAASGVFVGGAKYTFVQGGDGVMRGVRVHVEHPDTDDEKRTKYVLIARSTTTAVVVGLFTEDRVAQAKANHHIETVADALRDAGI